MGNYVNSSLIRDEHVVYEAKNHWIIFISISSFLTLFIAPLIENWTSEFAVTNKRVVIKLGLISRKTLEMNLSKIESRPTKRTLGEYVFFLDIESNGDTTQIQEALEALSQYTKVVRVFGHYDILGFNLPLR